jgi:hypothetical protein
MNEKLTELVDLVSQNDGINDKGKLTKLVSKHFELVKDRSIYYCDEFAIRFSSAKNRNFGNTVLSLSNLKKVDDKPVIICLVTPKKNYCFLANSTFLKKVSHSSEQLRENNIRGSFNGSDIMRDFEGIDNDSTNIETLFAIHHEIGFAGNLPRLVEATNNISPTGEKFLVSSTAESLILEAPRRAQRFIASKHHSELKAELDEKVDKFKNEILLAALIENVNVRGRVIEYLIAGEDEALRDQLVKALQEGDKGLPVFSTKNDLGDYHRTFPEFDTETDVKTKVMIFNSNPKAYNLDKILEFLAKDKSVFMFYFVGVNPGMTTKTVLVSMFQQDLLKATILLRHWAGRNSRGVSQFDGKAINALIAKPSSKVVEDEAVTFLKRLIAL